MRIKNFVTRGDIPSVIWSDKVTFYEGANKELLIFFSRE